MHLPNRSGSGRRRGGTTLLNCSGVEVRWVGVLTTDLSALSRRLANILPANVEPPLADVDSSSAASLKQTRCRWITP